MSVRVTITSGPLGPPVEPPQSHPNTGASVVFEGLVRPDEAGSTIDALDYEAYLPMAQTELERLAHEAISRFSVSAVFVEHSTGRVSAGECSFRLRIDSPHRVEALDAMGWFIDTMKQDVPIWKRPVVASKSQYKNIPIPRTT